MTTTTTNFCGEGVEMKMIGKKIRPLSDTPPERERERIRTEAPTSKEKRLSSKKRAKAYRVESKMMTNEESHLLSDPSDPSGSTRRPSSRPSSSSSVWKTAVASFVAGVVLTLLLVGVTNHPASRRTLSFSKSTVPLLGKKHKASSSPALHYFAKASTDFAASLPPLPPNIDDSFLADLATR